MSYTKDIEVKQWLSELESRIPADKKPYYNELRHCLGLATNKLVTKQTRDKAKLKLKWLRDYLYNGISIPLSDLDEEI